MINKKRSWFWPVQICCWLLIGFLNWLVQYVSGNFSTVTLCVNVGGIVFGGLLVTTLYRAYFKRRHTDLQIHAVKLIAFLFASALVQALGWLFILVVILLLFVGGKFLSLMQLVYNIVPLTGIMLAWNLVYLGYHLIKKYHQTEVQKWQLEAEVRQAQLGALKSQINPHFLFNSLNNIRALILEDPAQARQMLTRFSEIFRHALQHAEGREIKLADELAILRQYLELLQIQYEEKLQYRIIADERVLQAVIPPMILQLLVENAIKHGIALSADGGSITIEAQGNGEGILLSVKNTGTLKQKNELEDSLGIGLPNIRERLRLLYHDKATLTMEEQEPYVVVSIQIIY